MTRLTSPRPDDLLFSRGHGHPSRHYGVRSTDGVGAREDMANTWGSNIEPADPMCNMQNHYRCFIFLEPTATYGPFLVPLFSPPSLKTAQPREATDALRSDGTEAPSQPAWSEDRTEPSGIALSEADRDVASSFCCQRRRWRQTS